MEGGLHQRHLAHRDVHGGIRRWISFVSPDIVKNGEVVEVTVIPTGSIWERTDP